MCEECGEKLKGVVSEVAHILPKQYFKSVSKEDKNIIYLCGLFSKNQCHDKFDNLSNKLFKHMKVFESVKEKFKDLIKNNVTEKTTYKHFERYE